jgi:hypothetical protein
MVITIVPDVASTAGKTVKGAKKETEFRVHPLRSILIKVGERTSRRAISSPTARPTWRNSSPSRAKERAQHYIISEVMRIYELQGVSTARKHLEVIVKQMFSRVSVVASGDTGVSAGEIITDFEYERINKTQKEAGGEPAKGKQLLLGITEVSLTRASFLSAISFQNTPRKLAEAAVSGAVDRLVGLKENVIIGRLIPAGTGFPGSKKFAMVQEMEAEFAALAPAPEMPEPTTETVER